MNSVLIIDDDVAVLRSLQRICEAMDVNEVVTCSNVEAARMELGRRFFDVVVCDYRLASDDGVEFIASLRKRGEAVPVLFISGAPDSGGVLRGERLEATDFLGKPFSIADFRRALDRLIAH